MTPFRPKADLMRVLVSAALAIALAACGSSAADPTPPSASPQTGVGSAARPTFTPVAIALPGATAPATVSVALTAAPADPATSPEATAEPTPQSTIQPTGAPAPPAVPPVKPLRMSSPEYGVQAFMWWRPEVASRDVQAIRDAGFTWVKVGFGWRDIEGAGKGIYDWSRTDSIVEMANAENVDLLVRVDHQPAWTGGSFPLNGPPANLQDLADFLGGLAGRYRGRVRAYQVWNEPNLAREWGDQLPDPGAYVQLLGTAYQAIKAADPNAMVVSAGLSPTGSWSDEARPDDWYLESMYQAMGGSSQGYLDVLGAHGAGYKSPPEVDPGEVAANPDLGGHRAFAFRRVEDLRAIMVQYGDAGKQVALLEFGWTSDPRPESPYHWHAVSEETKAEYLVRAYQFAKQNWSPWIGVMSLIYMTDPDWTPNDEQYWWAITNPSYPELSPRPAYTALKNMPK